MYKLRRACALALCMCALFSLCACGRTSAPPAAQSPVIIVPQPGDVPSQTAAESGEPLQLSASEQYELNIFLSSFAEQRFEGFGDFDADLYSLVDFMHLYCKINSSSSIEYRKLPNGRTYESISLENANRVFERFFGRSAGVSDVSGYAKTAYDGDIVYSMYYDGSFCFEPADGESYNRIAVAESVTARSDSGYNVSFTVYELDIGRYFDENGVNPSYYSLSPADAAAKEELKPLQHGSAVVYPCTDAGRSTFRITSYSINS